MPVTDWATVKVPTSLLNIIDELAKKEGVPRHIIVSKAITLYRKLEQNKGGTKYLKGKKHSRGMWYAWKLMLSYAEMRIATKYRKCFPPTVLEKMFKQWYDTVMQIKERTKAITKEECDNVIKLTKDYIKTRKNTTLYQLNDIVRDIFYRVLGRT